jgi:hypothetical protein
VSDVQHEVAILQHLAGHAGIVQLQGVYEDERNIHLVMELCTGGDLLDYISRFGRLRESEAADIGRVMLTTLQHCHRCVDFRSNVFALQRPLQQAHAQLSQDAALQRTCARWGRTVCFMFANLEHCLLP